MERGHRQNEADSEDPKLIGVENQRPTTGDRKRNDHAEAMLPAKLREWRAKLIVQARQEKRFRFYSLYGLDESSGDAARWRAWAQVRANGELREWMG